ncbi:SDR family NAD(P)-dependent oxidoreductase [Pseudonocardia ammonioxydans]|uniref:SDR family NAD(P)-dependent oxidoreductase n=1 Tax=Pseudonocardia ammonioxydans TaxID=260086 RepID=UPI001C4335C3|nr:SDR family oxidoreductase [Pseudonocardia ammonioxydans]
MESQTGTTAEAVRRAQTAAVDRAVAEFGGSLEGQVAVVTGAARGIGAVLADTLATVGAKVAALDKTWDGADVHRKRLEDAGGLALETDITSEAAIEAAHTAVVEKYGHADVLINNAALVSETLFRPWGRRATLETTDEDWRAMFDVNVFGAVAITRRFVSAMAERGSGSVINVVSSGILSHSTGGGYYAARPYTVEMPYQAAKAAVTTFAFYLAEEVRAKGVSINSVMPGHTRASWFDDTARAYDGVGQTYFMRPVVSEHLLPITLFLAGQAEQGVTGRLYPVPEWNYDHGYGDLSFWQDHDLPEEVERMYARIESAMPPFQRSGLAQQGFDTGSALFVAALGNLAARGNSE